jgi:1-acyl-sn-glycerol-3-phosphate acyltransferase
MLLKGIAAVSAVLAVALAWGNPWWQLPLYFAAGYAVLFLLALGYLWLILRFVDITKEQVRDSKFYRYWMYIYIDALVSLVLAKVHTKGLEKVPTQGRFLLVCNHQQMADPGVILACLKKSQLAFISKQENMTMPVIGKFMHKIMCQHLDRDNDRQALRVILKCIQMIRDDQVSVGVFPEGTRSRDGKVHHFRSGVFKIAQKAQVPIVVCTINGTDKLFHNLKRLKRTHIHFHAVEVIPTAELQDKTTVEIADRVYEAMIADLGEEFREIPS